MKPTLNASLLIRNLRDTEDQSAQSARLPACLADARDIQALYDLCGDEPNALFPAPKMLRKFYQVLSDIPPKNASIAFL